MNSRKDGVNSLVVHEPDKDTDRKFRYNITKSLNFFIDKDNNVLTQDGNIIRNWESGNNEQ